MASTCLDGIHSADKRGISYFIHRHPTLVKMLQVGGMLSGGASIALFPQSLVVLGAGKAAALTLGTAAMGLASLVSYTVLDILVPPHHNMKTHHFTEGECPGGRLYYENDVPILSLESDNPHVAGKASGYLCGSVIKQMVSRLHFALHTLANRPRAEELRGVLAQVRQTIPQRYLDEMQGVVDGYNQWVDEQYAWKRPSKLTLDELLLVHLMPDSMYFSPERGREAPLVGCTALVEMQKDRGPTVARNMDWPSFGILGGYTLVVHRKSNRNIAGSVEVGLPAFVGTITGMNDRGLSLSMNVCLSARPIDKIKGMPACFYNRALLESCSSVADTRFFFKRKSPLGPYHLTVSDPYSSESTRLNWSSSWLFGKTRVCKASSKDPLVTLNDSTAGTVSHPVSQDPRWRSIQRFFTTLRQNGTSLASALSIPFVDNWLTTYRVVVEPRARRFQLAFDNAFAGSAPLREISVNEMLKMDQHSRDWYQRLSSLWCWIF